MRREDGFGWGCLGYTLLVLATPTGASASGEFTSPTAITNATIVVGDGVTIPNGTILIADGRIVDVGAGVEVPAHAERIDATGLIAYPGFIDAHVHLGIPKDARTPEQRQRTEDVNPDPREGPIAKTRFANRRGLRPQSRARKQYVPDEKLLKAHRAAGFTVALIAPRDGILSGTSMMLNLSDTPIRRSVLMADAAMHASFDPGEEGEYPRTPLGVFAQFRQVVLDARRHAKLRKYNERHPSTSRRPPSDAALDALQPLLARSQRLIMEANSENEIRRTLDLAREFNLDVAISGAKEAWKVIDRLRHEGVPLIVSLKFDEEPEYGRKKSSATADAPEEETASEKEKKVHEPLKLRKERRRLWEEQVDNLIRLHEAGIECSLRTRDFATQGKSPDARPSREGKPRGGFFKNLRLVIERGLPEDAAVTALTLAPARLLGMQEQLGTIARNRLANVTLMSGPLADKKSNVKFVFIEGRKFVIDPDDRAKPDKKPGDHDEPAEATEESGPEWQVEIKADRTPNTRTGGSVLIKNATIIPVTAPTLRRASILIVDGKISAVGPNLEGPYGVTTIDADGRFVIPGFVDCHSHLGVDAVNEAALAISAEVRIADVIDPHSVGIYRAVAGGTTTNHVMHGSANPIGGQNVILKLKYGRPASEMLIADAPRTIKFALGENVKQSNFPKRWDTRFPKSRMGVEGTIRAALEAGRAYRREWETYREQSQAGLDLPVPRRDLRLEALADVLSGELTVHAHCYRSDEILRLMVVAEEYGFRIGTLQHVLEGYRIAPEIARHGAGASSFANDWAYKIEAYGAIPHNAALMTEHGIVSSVNSDSPSTIRYLGQEAAKCIRWGGLDKNQALRLVTINPAMQLRIEHRVGSLEVGKDGDIAIFNGHPLNTFSRCIMTLIEGEVYFEDDQPAPTEQADQLKHPGRPDMTIPQTRNRTYAIVSATVHPISGPAIERGTVVIVDDKIQAVGANVAVPPGAGVIDGTGLHVYPGLIDAGSRVGLYEIGSLRATNDDLELGSFNAHLHTASAVHPHSEHVRIARTVGITTALAVPRGARIAGQSAVIHLDGWTLRDMLLVEAFGLHMNVPSLPVKMPTDKEKKKKLEQKHKKDLRALEEYIAKSRRYAAARELAENGDDTIDFDVDLSLEAMRPYVQGEKPVVFAAQTYKQLRDAIDFAEKHQLRCIISGGQEAWKIAAELAEKKIPVIVGTPLSYPSSDFEPVHSVYRCAGELNRAGVRFCFASNSAASAYNLGTQVGMAVAHGLPRERAEYALTLGAAEMLGIADRRGSIEVGKQADLIVTTDTPLQTASVVTHMFIDGRPIELTSMHTESYEKFRARPQPNLPPAATLLGPPSLTGR